MARVSLKKLKETWIHDAFLVTVFLKGIDGILEIVLGLLLIFTDEFSDIVFFLTRDAIIDDPNNYFAMHLRAFASQSHEVFIIGGLYLVVHGIVKVFIAGSLWRNYSWAYPAAIVLLALFIFYELIHIFRTGSVPFMGLAVFDIAMLWLVGYEYRHSPHQA